MFDNIEKAIRSCHKIIIKEERYENEFLLGMDYKKDPYWTLIENLIDGATSPGDKAVFLISAIEDLEMLMEFSKKHPEFLFVKEKNIEQGLIKLDKKTALWNQLTTQDKEKILNELSDLYSNKIW